MRTIKRAMRRLLIVAFSAAIVVSFAVTFLPTEQANNPLVRNRPVDYLMSFVYAILLCLGLALIFSPIWMSIGEALLGEALDGEGLLIRLLLGCIAFFSFFVLLEYFSKFLKAQVGLVGSLIIILGMFCGVMITMVIRVLRSG